MSVRCKFKVTSITMQEGSRRVRDEAGDWKRPDNVSRGGFVMEPCLSGTVKMSPVYANDDPRHENSKFWDASPSGSFEMNVNNLAALQELKVGKEYYIGISPAD